MKRPIDREHIFQVRLKEFVRDAIDVPHEFFAFDRSKAAGRFSHMRQKARGVRKGTPDTLLLVKGFAPIWCELKAPGNKPDDAQIAVGGDLLRVGSWWSWCDTVEKYRLWLNAIGVPMRANADVLAMHADARVAGLIAAAEMKRGDLPKVARAKKAAPRFTTGKRAGAKLRAAGIL